MNINKEKKHQQQQSFLNFMCAQFQPLLFLLMARIIIQIKDIRIFHIIPKKTDSLPSLMIFVHQVMDYELKLKIVL